MDLRLVTMAGALGALALSCGPAVEVSRAPDACERWERFDEDLRACLVRDELRSCASEDALARCGVGQVCDSGWCIDDEYLVYIVQEPSDARISRASDNVLYFMARRGAERFNRAGYLDKPVRVVRLEVDDSTEATFREGLSALRGPNTLAILTRASNDIRDIQRALLGDRIVQLGISAVSSEFSELEQSWNRYNFAVQSGPAVYFASLLRVLERRLEPLPESSNFEDYVSDTTHRCERSGIVISDAIFGGYFASEFLDTFGAAPNLEVASVFDIGSDSFTGRDDIYEQMTREGVSCVVILGLGGSTNETELLALMDGYEDWLAARGESVPRWRWIFANGFEYRIWRDQLEALGRIAGFPGVLGPTPEEETNPEVEQVLSESLQGYETLAAQECETFGVSECETWFDRSELAERRSLLAYTEDLINLALLAAVRMERSGDTRWHAREDYRESVVSVTSVSASHAVCDRNTLPECVLEAQRGNAIHYTGVTGDLVLGPDGRVRTERGVLTFVELTEEGEERVLETVNREDAYDYLVRIEAAEGER